MRSQYYGLATVGAWQRDQATLDPESAGLYRMGLEGIRSGVGAQGGPGSFTQPFATESDAMEALRAQFASGAMPGMGGEGGAPPGCPVS